MIKPIEELTIMNDFLFCVVMRQEKYCKPLLECILNIRIKKIDYLNDQETIGAAVPNAKSIRLDVYVEDEQGTVYDLEVQTTDKRDLGKRTRYYQSMMDIRVLEKGETYKKLRKSFVIFICNFDPYGASRYIYTFRNRCDEVPELVLDDQAAKIVVNTKGTVGDISEELKAVIRYMDSGAATDGYTRELETEVANVKTDEKVRMQYMLLSDRFAEEQNIGEYKRVVSQIRDASNDFSIKQMSKLFKITEIGCNRAVECINAHPDWSDVQIAEEVNWEE